MKNKDDTQSLLFAATYVVVASCMLVKAINQISGHLVGRREQIQEDLTQLFEYSCETDDQLYDLQIKTGIRDEKGDFVEKEK